MRTIAIIGLSLICCTWAAFAQVVSSSPVPASASKPASVPIPKFLVYRHFLGSVNDLNNKAVAAGASDPYKFAEPFQRANLETADLDVILKEARALDSDLGQHGEKVKAVVAEYRARAQNAVSNGLPLPPAPSEVRQLQAMRTAILVQHMTSVQAALGPPKTAQLDAFLEHEFAPHISLKALARPPAGTSSEIPKQSFAHGQQ